MEKPLYIPPGKRGHKVTTFCYHCGMNVRDVCKLDGRPLQKCLHGDEHVFKAIVYKPNSKSRSTKTFESRNLDQVIAEAKIFEQTVKGKLPVTNEAQKISAP